MLSSRFVMTVGKPVAGLGRDAADLLVEDLGQVAEAVGRWRFLAGRPAAALLGEVAAAAC